MRTPRSSGEDNEGRDLEARSFEFAVAVVRLAAQLPERTPAALTERLVQLGTGIGADVHEAYASHGRRTHLTRLESARRASREIDYWLRLLGGSDLVALHALEPFLSESRNLHALLTNLCALTREDLKTG